MRKQDYAILAETIKKHGVTHARAPYHYDTAEQAKGATIAAERIARTFAHFASVNKTAFLTACGVDTSGDN